MHWLSLSLECRLGRPLCVAAVVRTAVLVHAHLLLPLASTTCFYRGQYYKRALVDCDATRRINARSVRICAHVR